MKTIESVEAYPLAWPEGVKRSANRLRSRFKETTIHRCRELLKSEVRRLGGRDLIISTNQRTRADGEPVASAKEPQDSGAAAYFDLKGRTVCLACDKWRKLYENLYAIAKTIEAMRAVDRWGVSDLLDRMFTGFVALTDDAGKTWPAILKVNGDATAEEIKLAYRERMKEVHPDKGGDSKRAAEINQAYREALQERNREN